MFAYPEYDFLSEPYVIKRKTLLHHFSVFNCLRHQDEIKIENLVGYELAKDLSRNSTKSQAPSTVKELLPSLTIMYD